MRFVGISPEAVESLAKYAMEQMTDVSLYRGSYMSAHVLLNLLNELGKRGKM